MMNYRITQVPGIPGNTFARKSSFERAVKCAMDAQNSNPLYEYKVYYDGDVEACFSSKEGEE